MALSDLNAALTSFGNAVSGAVTRKVANAFTADNASALNGQTSSQMVAAVNTVTNTHAARTDNPHATTAAEIGSYPSGTIDTMVASLLPSGIVPVSAFGDALGTAIPATVNTSNNTLNFAANIPCLIAGQAFTLGAYSLPYTVNGTMYYYLKLTAGVVSLINSSTVLAESNTTMFVGKITTNSSGVVTTNTIGRVVRLDVYRVSTTAVGSAISVSNGTPDAAADLAWT